MHSIRSVRPAEAKPEGPIAMLLECHARIRRFTATARRLPDAVSAPDAEVAEAAAALHRYHSVALPLHQADEDQSLRPRLLALPDLPEAIAVAIKNMSAQHGDLEAVITEQLAMWQTLSTEPRALPSLASPLRKGADRLVEMWAAHLTLEEDIIFPTASRLAPEVSAALLGEMRARRH